MKLHLYFSSPHSWEHGTNSPSSKTKPALKSQRKQKKAISSNLCEGPHLVARVVTRGRVNYSGGMRTRSDCFKMRDTETRKKGGKSTCLSLTLNPGRPLLGVHLHPPVDPGSALSLVLSPGGEPERTRCFPSHVMHLYRDGQSNAPSLLLPSSPEPNNMFFWLSAWRPCQGFHMFHCKGALLVRGFIPQYWETRPQEIPSEPERTTPILQSD